MFKEPDTDYQRSESNHWKPTPDLVRAARVYIGVAAVALVLTALTDQHGIMIGALATMIAAWFVVDAAD